MYIHQIKNQRGIIEFMPGIGEISSYVFCGPWWRPFLIYIP